MALNLRKIAGSHNRCPTAHMRNFELKHKTSRYRLAGLLLLLALSLLACSRHVQEVRHAEPTIPVKTPTPKPAETIQSSLPTIAYTIQVGAFSTTERAARFALGLKHQGLDAYYFIDADGLCKVRFEKFKSKAAAKQRALDLQEAGRIEGFFIVEPITPVPHYNPKLELRQNIVQTVHRFIGTPYRWGGESSSRGFDCSGLTMTVYRLNGLELPRNSRSQFRAGTPISREALQKGDLVFFSTNGRKGVSHVGVYTGQGKFIHAPGRGKRIRVASLGNVYFSRRYMGARRYF